MKLSAFFVLLAASASGADAQVNTVSAVRCFTKLGPKSTAQVNTVSRVLTLPIYAFRKRTITPTSTITPPPVLVTTTGTVTAYSETTVTTDTISIIPPTTIATPAGFLPIESTLPGAADAADKRALLAPELEDRASQQLRTCRGVNGKPVLSPAAYPTAVVCAGLVFAISTKYSTVTASSTVTTTLPATTLVGISLITTTVYSSKVVTNTVIPPQETRYAACADNNMVNRINGQKIGGVGIQNTGDFVFLRAITTAYDCCVACQVYSSTVPGQTCSLSVFSPNGFGCTLAVSTDGTCPSSENVGPGVCYGCPNAADIASNGCTGVTRSIGSYTYTS